MKKKLLFKLFIFAVIGAFVTVTSCKDYDDDITNLQDQITSLKTTVDAINGSGKIIKSVTSTADGVVITLKDGPSYTITNGADGANGAPGSVVTIGENGNWFIDDVDTGLAAQGPAGAPGEKGETGEAGAPGADGDYYYPNEDGFWYKVDGVTGEEEATTMAWLPAGTITAVFDAETGNVTLYNVEGASGPIALGPNLAIVSLHVIPDYVADEGGALPILLFNPLVTEDCGEIVPATVAKFRVSPSNASVDAIDIENIALLYNNPTVRSSAIAPVATFKSLEDGVLEVWVEINTEEVEDGTTDKIDQLQLEVPMLSGAKVYSDWMTVDAEKIEDIILVNSQDEELVTDWEEYEIPVLLDDAKALAKEDSAVVELVYNETLDLLDVVDTWAVDIAAMLNLDTYGLSYVFDLNDADGDPIEYKLGTNATDQQQFIKLEGSEISTRVYDIDEPNPAAIDRTPIVHVQLMNGDCMVIEGFIKINIIEAQPEPIDPVTFVVDGGVEAGCEDFVLRVGTQAMNENFYAVAKVTKTFFHANYDWEETTGGVGTITEEVDPNDTESYNLVWTVTETDLWDNIGETITKSGTYTYGPNVIKVTFTAEVSQPTADLSDIMITNYWDANKTYIQHNVAVPALGATDPSLATFANNINNAFQTTADKLIDLEAANEDYAGYTYEYFFADDQPITEVDGIEISVDATGKQLLASDDEGVTTEVVATINPQAAGTGDILAYNELSDLGKYLLNKGPEFMKAKLYMALLNECDRELDLVGDFDGSFLVHFLRPVNVEGQAADNFVDGVDVGAEGSVLDIKSVVRLSDWRNYAKSVTTYYFEPDNDNYYDYYDVTAITVDVANITPEGLMTSGGTELTELPSTIEIAQTAPDATYDFGTLTYENNGATLVEEFTLKVPVTVSYKWGDVQTIVDVVVRPTSATKSAQ